MYHYYIFHKPAGCITALRDEREPTILAYLGALDMTKLRPVGRLDRDTEGLLILTDDGAYNQRMTHPDSGIEKEYFFWAIGTFSEEKRERLAQGVDLSVAGIRTKEKAACSEKKTKAAKTVPAQRKAETASGKKESRTARPARAVLLQESRLADIHEFIKGKKREHILKNRPDTPVFSGCITVTQGRRHEVKRLLKSVGCYCVYLKRVRMGDVMLPEHLRAGEVQEFVP